MSDRPVPRKHNWPRMLAITLVAGALVFSTAGWVAWRIFSALPAYRGGQMKTSGTLWSFQEEMTEYREHNGQYPADFRTLPALQKRLSDNGELLDGWRQPFVYTPSADGYRLCSYGMDAVPGGAGFDHDMCVDAHSAPNADWTSGDPTLRQFLRHPGAQRPLLISGFAGLLAMGVYLFSGKSEAVWPPRGLQLALSMLRTWAFSVFIAAILIFLSSPHGH